MNVSALVEQLRQRRTANVGVAVLRIFLAFAFIPPGLKKVVGQPFTAPTNSGPFHDFLHAFHAASGLYAFVGWCQLTVALLLLSQRFATLGAALLLPILSVIFVFCWTTGVYPTATVVTLMLCATLGLLVWDLPKWRGALAADTAPLETRLAPAPIDQRFWAMAGFLIVTPYLLVCAVTGEIYRPRGAAMARPEFLVFPLMLLMLGVALALDRRRAR